MKMKRFWLVLFSITALLLTSFSKNYTAKPPLKPFVVVLDAGHGGHDPGNLGNGYLEKNIALQIVLQVGSILEKNKDIKVIYTRDDDTFVDLFVRGEIANKANADLFVSVHCDSHSSDAHGAGTFVLGLHANKQNFEIAKKENSVIYLEDNFEANYAEYDINSPESVIGLTILQEEFLDQSIALAKKIQDNFSNKLRRKNRKVKQAGFIVLHQTFMPSVLVETGFLTNANEGKYLNSKKGQTEMGTAIANAILNYKEERIIYNEPERLPEGNSKEITISAAEDTVPEVLKTPEKTVSEEKVVTEEVKANTTQVAKKVDEKITPAKKEEKTPPPPIVVKKEPAINQTNTAAVIFKIQIFATDKDFSVNGDHFNGLNRISKEPVRNLYRYMYGNTNSYDQAKLLKSNADAKGYPTSYIVAYKDGKRITIAEAKKYLSQ